MNLHFPIVNPNSSSGLDVRDLPQTAAPDASDLALIVTPTGTFLVPLSSIQTAGVGGTNVPPFNGSPEGVVTAVPGAVGLQLDGPNSVWIKATGSGNTGWTEIIA